MLIKTIISYVIAITIIAVGCKLLDAPIMEVISFMGLFLLIENNLKITEIYNFNKNDIEYEKDLNNE